MKKLLFNTGIVFLISMNGFSQSYLWGAGGGGNYIIQKPQSDTSFNGLTVYFNIFFPLIRNTDLLVMDIGFNYGEFSSKESNFEKKKPGGNGFLELNVKPLQKNYSFLQPIIGLGVQYFQYPEAMKKVSLYPKVNLEISGVIEIYYKYEIPLDLKKGYSTIGIGFRLHSN
jgi:hypothetical protein